MVDFIIVAVLVIVIGAAVVYIRKAKKSGAKCIGCPSGGNCSHNHSKSSGCSCGCGGEHEKEGKGECCCHADTEE